jgi:hypothetical protein
MLELQAKHGMLSFSKFESKRFFAISNATDAFSARQVKYCEIFHDLFLDHFRRKGFPVTAPTDQLEIAMFDSPEGFETYLGQKMSDGITGIYHPASNRLVIYDLAYNRLVQDQKKKGEKTASNIKSRLDRDAFLRKVERLHGDLAQDLNLTTIMHECAHQVSFNCGLLQRDRDVPAWLAEGLACYCEITTEGSWQAIGVSNSPRIVMLERDKGHYFSLKALVESDRWLQSRPLLGYAQCWALFHWLMHERPTQLRRYLALIADRRDSNGRLQDFALTFGTDLAALNREYDAYLASLLKKHPPREGR